jgi:hypothetical protein
VFLESLPSISLKTATKEIGQGVHHDRPRPSIWATRYLGEKGDEGSASSESIGNKRFLDRPGYALDFRRKNLLLPDTYSNHASTSRFVNMTFAFGYAVINSSAKHAAGTSQTASTPNCISYQFALIS